MHYGLIIRSLADLRKKPEFHSERKTQLLYNEPVRLGTKRKGYVRAVLADGYRGWVDERALLRVTAEEFTAFVKALNYQIISPSVRVVRSGHKKSFPCRMIFYGTRVRLTEQEKNSGVISLHDGRRIKIGFKHLAPVTGSIGGEQCRERIVKEAGKFLGTPYLWGGLTPCGIDCSGLVQIIYRVAAGIGLPRDSRDQCKTGVRIARDAVASGDLLFFKGHVAIGIDKYRIIHASLSAGGVTIDSLNPKDNTFLKSLDESFLEVRRVIP
jgi:hypothetical protein